MFMLRGLLSFESHSSTQPAAVTSLISMLNSYSPAGRVKKRGREGKREEERAQGRTEGGEGKRKGEGERGGRRGERGKENERGGKERGRGRAE